MARALCQTAGDRLFRATTPAPQANQTRAPQVSSVRSTPAVDSASTQLVVDPEEPLEAGWIEKGWFPALAAPTVRAPLEEEEEIDVEVWLGCG